MAMVALRKGELQSLARVRGIDVDPKWLKRDLVGALAQKSLRQIQESGDSAWGLQKRLGLVSPMLCYSSFSKLKESVREEIRNDPEWIVEEKFDGARVILTFHPDEGIRIWGREHSPNSLLPMEFTDRVLFFTSAGVVLPAEWQGTESFVLDGEMFFRDPPYLGSLSEEEEKRREHVPLTEIAMQFSRQQVKEFQYQSPLEFEVFDVLEYDGNSTRDFPLKDRKKTLDVMFKDSIPIHYSCFRQTWWSANTIEKSSLFEEVKERGGEGVVFKNLAMSYLAEERKSRRHMIKWK